MRAWTGRRSLSLLPGWLLIDKGRGSMQLLTCLPSAKYPGVPACAHDLETALALKEACLQLDTAEVGVGRCLKRGLCLSGYV